MPTGRIERHGTQVSWSASGSINLELAPKPYTITELWVVCRPSVTTTTATNLNDYWDRIISTLSLTGAGKTYFDFRNLRIAYWFTQFAGFGVPRPTVVADSATTLVNQFVYRFHFGTRPEDGPFDLTAGIPPVTAGNLTLQGTFGAATAMGTNVTTTDADLDVYLVGVQPDQGDAPSAYMPKAIPVWQMQTPTPTATSSAFATQHNIPSGDYLHSILVMTTNGTGTPRDDSVLNSLNVYNQLENREIVSFGGQSGSVLDYKAAELITQFALAEPVNRYPSDNVSTAMTAVSATNGVPVVTQGVNSGLVWLPLHKFGKVRGRGHPLYGVDLTHVATGDLQLRYGVSDATGVTLDVFYRKYQPL